MSGTPATIGPWLGGLNTRSDPTMLADEELVECLNMEVDLDGSLRSRPAILDTGDEVTLDTTGNVKLLGWYRTGSTDYLILSDGNSTTYAYDGSTVTTVTSTFAASAMTTFNGVAWLVSPIGEASPGGYWSPGGGFVADNDMPHGSAIVTLKFRMWVVGGLEATTNVTRLYYSDLLGEDLWIAVNEFIDIGAGDGQSLVSLVVYYDNLLIFRNRSIWTLNYSSDPGKDGSVIKLVDGIGLQSELALAQLNESVYFFYQDRAYRFINNRADQINVKVPFRSGDKASGVASGREYLVSVYGTRIFFTFYDVTYVYSTDTRTWSRWRTDVWASIGQVMMRPASGEYARAFLVSNYAVAAGGTRKAKLLSMEDRTSAQGETFLCEVRTKTFDFGVSARHKRLHWWAVDTDMSSVGNAYVIPTRNVDLPLWSQFLLSTWGDLLSGGTTWGAGGDAPYAVQEIDTRGAARNRKIIKALKSLRFRQVYFRLVLETKGDLDTAPLRVYAITAFVSQKSIVPAAVTS